MMPKRKKNVVETATEADGAKLLGSNGREGRDTTPPQSKLRSDLEFILRRRPDLPAHMAAKLGGILNNRVPELEERVGREEEKAVVFVKAISRLKETIGAAQEEDAAVNAACVKVKEALSKSKYDATTAALIAEFRELYLSRVSSFLRLVGRNYPDLRSQVEFLQSILRPGAAVPADAVAAAFQCGLCVADRIALAPPLAIDPFFPHHRKIARAKLAAIRKLVEAGADARRTPEETKQAALDRWNEEYEHFGKKLVADMRTAKALKISRGTVRRLRQSAGL
jgi:hypothetical protein